MLSRQWLGNGLPEERPPARLPERDGPGASPVKPSRIQPVMGALFRVFGVFRGFCGFEGTKPRDAEDEAKPRDLVKPSLPDRKFPEGCRRRRRIKLGTVKFGSNACHKRQIYED